MDWEQLKNELKYHLLANSKGAKPYGLQLRMVVLDEVLAYLQQYYTLSEKGTNTLTPTTSNNETK